jgi:2-oxoglutarate/2-oxoacid ferredoxin oxidoreductase subunit beta
VAVAELPKPLTLKDYKSDDHITWCPGCGDFAIVTGIQTALAQLQIPPHKVMVFSGIGCSGKTPHYIEAYGFHTLHGRVLPNATGGRLANTGCTVLAVGGDGDGLGIGAGYFVNSGRRNADFTYLMFNNGVYGLTKGQGAPTLAKGLRTKSMPEPAIQDSINPLALAVGSGYTFVARAYSLQTKSLAAIIAKAIEHKGSAFVDVLQTCPTYNDLQTKGWFEEKLNDKPRMYWMEEEGYDGVVKDPSSMDEIIAKKAQAMAKSYEWGDRIPLGIFYQARLRTYEEELAERLPDYGTKPLVDWDVAHRDITKLQAALR